jgi:hypothetical protein
VFLLLGLRPVASVLLVVTFVCGHCGTAARQRIVREQQKITLFFVPLLSIRTRWSVECDHCGRSTELSKQQAEHALQWSASHDRAVA